MFPFYTLERSVRYVFQGLRSRPWKGITCKTLHFWDVPHEEYLISTDPYMKQIDTSRSLAVVSRFSCIIYKSNLKSWYVLIYFEKGVWRGQAARPRARPEGGTANLHVNHYCRWFRNPAFTTWTTGSLSLGFIHSRCSGISEPSTVCVCVYKYIYIFIYVYIRIYTQQHV